jgi:hypothetical protein
MNSVTLLCDIVHWFRLYNALACHVSRHCLQMKNVNFLLHVYFYLPVGVKVSFEWVTLRLKVSAAWRIFFSTKNMQCFMLLHENESMNSVRHWAEVTSYMAHFCIPPYLLEQGSSQRQSSWKKLKNIYIKASMYSTYILLLIQEMWHTVQHMVRVYCM